MYVKGTNLGFGLEEVPNRIVDLLILFALIFLGILFFVPKAQSQNAIRVAGRNEHNLVDEAVLLLQYRHRSLINGVGKLLRFPGLAGHFHYACKHVLAPFYGWKVKGTRRGRGSRKLLILEGTTLPPPIIRVNCPSLVQPAIQALFVDVMAVKADQHCSTSLLPQCEQRTSPSS